MAISGYYLNDLMSRRSLMETINSDKLKMGQRDKHIVLRDVHILPIPEQPILQTRLLLPLQSLSNLDAIVTNQSHSSRPLSCSRYFSILPRNKVAHVSVILEMVEIFE